MLTKQYALGLALLVVVACSEPGPLWFDLIGLVLGFYLMIADTTRQPKEPTND